MKGLHILAEWHDCACPPTQLTDPERIARACRTACEAHGLNIVGELFHRFDPGADGQTGVTGTLVLAESHLCLHTWPELASVTLDIYVCNLSGDHSARARAAYADLARCFAPARETRRDIRRGDPAA